MQVYMLPVPPSANRWWRRAGRMIYKSKEAREYQRDARGFLERQGWTPAECIALGHEVAIRMVWYRGARMGDLDKRVPVMRDALQGLLYVNDKQIKDERNTCVDLPKRKGGGVEGIPRIEFYVWVM